jgi:hypothetical protein
LLSVQERSHQIASWTIEDRGGAAHAMSTFEIPLTQVMTYDRLWVYRWRLRDFEQFIGCRCLMMKIVRNRKGFDSDAPLQGTNTMGLSEGNGHMHNRLKTCCGLILPLAGKVIHSLIIVMVTIILVVSMTHAQSAPGSQELSANELARRVVTNELKFQDDDHDHWMYRQEKEEAGQKQVKAIIETKYGVLSQLLSINDHPLTAKEQQKENQRIQELVSNPDEQRKLQRTRNAEAEPGRRLFKMLPDAFMFNYVDREGDLIKLSFRPNLNFQPPSLEARVFHDMEGELWIDGKQERLAAINGHLMEAVKFGGGLLGRLDKGGYFDVRQAEVAAGHWDMTAMVVDMRGKALLLKTINVQQTESRRDFRRVPDDLTLAQAGDILNRQIVVAKSR